MDFWGLPMPLGYSTPAVSFPPYGGYRWASLRFQMLGGFYCPNLFHIYTRQDWIQSFPDCMDSGGWALRVLEYNRNFPAKTSPCRHWCGYTSDGLAGRNRRWILRSSEIV